MVQILNALGSNFKLLPLPQAYRDLGLEVEVSALCADKMLLAWYHLHKAEVFAVLTDDSDFYVYGVHRVRNVSTSPRFAWDL